MRIGMVKRLRITYAVWRALGRKNHNSMFAFAVAHEGICADVSSGNLPADYVKSLESELKSARGYDYEHKTT